MSLLLPRFASSCFLHASLTLRAVAVSPKGSPCPRRHCCCEDMSLLGAAPPNPQVDIFYQDSSILNRPDSNGMMTSVTTMQIESADSQASYKDGVLVVLIISLTARDNVPCRFTHSFFLAPQEKGGYVVLNDIFRFVDPSQPRGGCESMATSVEHETLHPVKNIDNGEEVIKPMEHDPIETSIVVAIDLEVHVGQYDDQPVSEIVVSVSQDDEPKKSYVYIVYKVNRSSALNSMPVSKPKVSLPKAAPKVDAINPNKHPTPSSKPSITSEATVSTAENVPEINPNDVEGQSVYIRNLPLSTTPKEVEVEFKKFGPIRPGRVQVRKHKVELFCFGFVEFELLDYMQAVIKSSPITIVVNNVVINSGNGGRGRYLAGRGSYPNDNFRCRRGYGGNQSYAELMGFFYSNVKLLSLGQAKFDSIMNFELKIRKKNIKIEMTDYINNQTEATKYRSLNINKSIGDLWLEIKESSEASRALAPPPGRRPPRDQRPATAHRRTAFRPPPAAGPPPSVGSPPGRRLPPDRRPPRDQRPAVARRRTAFRPPPAAGPTPGRQTAARPPPAGLQPDLRRTTALPATCSQSTARLPPAAGLQPDLRWTTGRPSNHRPAAACCRTTTRPPPAAGLQLDLRLTTARPPPAAGPSPGRCLPDFSPTFVGLPPGRHLPDIHTSVSRPLTVSPNYCNSTASKSRDGIPNNVKETQDAENEKPQAVKATLERLRPAWLKVFYTG
ncbi:hypothetical protein KFK09_018890 [Dendrobium nobile]|uniref:Uncharacterized protein n=1 Tax=Dendrobium nobile TaxID=94219 RepID=A0A8T3AX71_DENNO|nr:hypothetical protein KFK09_018890 [Dendrobium nobile]